MTVNIPLPTVHVLYENAAWLPPLEAGLAAEGFPFELHFLGEGQLDPSQPPPIGIYWNRMSPSAHTRGHGAGIGLTREWLYYLESWGRPVINGSRSFELEVSKFRQDLALRRAGIETPRTVLVVGRDALLAAGRTFEGPFITKHNQGGKGLGIQLFDSPELLSRWVTQGGFDPGPNEQVVLQEYIEPAQGHITRVELVGGRFVLAMNSSTEGGFQLCPADACQIPASPDVCPADGMPAPEKFTPAELDPEDPLVQAYVRFCATEGFDIAGIEFMTDKRGRRLTYDVNGNTNYNSALGRRLGIDGMRECARWLHASVRNGRWARALREPPDPTAASEFSPPPSA